MIETWRPIAGYEGIYSVSDLGRVMSHGRVVVRGASRMRLRDRLLRQNPDTHGYPGVGLHRDGKQSTKKVYLLVANAFLDPCPDGHECAHEDGDASNSRRSNLRWSTHAENMADMRKHGTLQFGDANPATKLSDVQARALFNDPRGPVELARAYGISHSNASRIKAGKARQSATGAMR